MGAQITNSRPFSHARFRLLVTGAFLLRQGINGNKRLEIKFHIFNVLQGIAQMLSVFCVLPLLWVLDPTLDQAERLKQVLAWISLDQKPNFALYYVCLVIAVILILKFLIQLVHAHIQAKLICTVRYRLCWSVIEKQIQKSLFSHDSENISRLVFHDLGIVVQSFLLSYLKLVSELVILICFLMLVLWFNPVESWVALSVVVACGVCGHMLFRSKLAKASEGFHSRYHRFSQLIKDIETDMLEIEMTDSKRPVADVYYKTSGELSEFDQSKSFLELCPRAFIEFLGAAFFVILVLGLGIGLDTGVTNQGAAPTTYLVLMGVIMFRLLPVVYNISLHVTQMKSSYPVARSFKKELEERHASFGQDHKGSSLSTIATQGLTYLYPNSQSLISYPDFEIRKGQWLGINGHSGSGKSTLIKIILGLLCEQSGQILINGKSVSPIQRRQIWPEVGYVPQQTRLRRTMLRNFDFTKQASSSGADDFNAILRVVGFDEAFIARIGDLTTSHELSGGEQQRIGLARVLGRRPTLLILDEPFTGLESSKIEEIIQNLKRLEGLDFVIIASHQSHVLRFCDQFITLNATSSSNNAMIPTDDVA